MPEQKQLTIDGTQVLWKLYRKKAGAHDIVKLCIGKPRPERDWTSHKIGHDVVSACETSSALTAAVRLMAAEVMGLDAEMVKHKARDGCDHCQSSPSLTANVTTSLTTKVSDSPSSLPSQVVVEEVGVELSAQPPER